MGQPLEVDNDQLRANTEADPLTSTWEVAEELNINNTMVIQHFWIKLERWESSISECLMRWLQFRRIIFKCGLLLSYATTAKYFLIRLWYATKSGFYTTIAMTSSVVGLRRSSKAFPKAKLVPRKVMVTAWCSVACLIHYSFLNPGETITSEKNAQQIDEMHWKRKHLQPALIHRKGPIPLHDNTQLHIMQPTLQKLSELGYKVFLIHHTHLTSHQPTTTFSGISTTFCWENAFQELVESWSIHFYATGINLFLVGKNVLIVMTLILINKDVFEPSYNDLKFMVWNHNYFCTKLILKMFYWNTAVPIRLPTICDCFHPLTA